MKHKEIKSILKSIAIFITLVFTCIVAYSFLKFSSIIASLPSVDINQIYVLESTKIYDQDRHLLVELGIEKRDIITYEKISPNMVNALVAIEDNHFFEHNGIDYKRIIGALYEDIKSYSYKEGASTITQQLVKLSYLSNEKTLNRKVTEIFLSVELESKLSKEKIMEAYLNRILFGGRIYGVEKASKHYFGKHAEDLNYEEAAILAGMVQSPNRFNPNKNPKLSKARQKLVLQKMYENQFITEEELEIGLSHSISELIKEPVITDEYEEYNEYIDQVIFELEQKYYLDPWKGGLKVYTYLDKDIQDYLHEIENDPSNHPNEKTQTGIIILETDSGIIRGIGGGRDYTGSLSFNYATDAKRQPGSTIKPILDYGPAIEYLNYSTGQPLFDDKSYYNTLGSRYVAIENYDNKYKGYLTMREAIIDSRNVTAVKTYRQVGEENAYKFAEKLGISTKEKKTEAHAIGGYQFGFSVLDMAAAYAPFGNGGYYSEPITINYIIKNNKKIQITKKKLQAMKPETAYLMSDILHDNMITGTATRANVFDLYIAGKTGQTNYDYETRKKFDFPSNSVRDSWFIGYTSKYTTAVWLGYDKIGEDSYLTSTEAKKSLDIFRKVMGKIHPFKSDSETFPRPESIVEVEIETHQDPIKLPSKYTPSSYRKKELFVKGYEPSEISERFKPLDTPKNFISYYDYEKQQLVLKWDKYPSDFLASDYKLMESIHKVENVYDHFKNQTLKEFYQTNGNFNPSFLSDEHISDIQNKYCGNEGEKSEFCPFQPTQKLNSYIDFLEILKGYEISLLTEDEIPLLSAGEISELRGYSVWNGYRNGLYSNLGNIQYTITGRQGDFLVKLYTGTYLNEVKVNMTIDQFLEYDSFSIYADYSKYRYKLQSDPNISLNPFFNLY